MDQKEFRSQFFSCVGGAALCGVILVGSTGCGDSSPPYPGFFSGLTSQETGCGIDQVTSSDACVARFNIGEDNALVADPAVDANLSADLRCDDGAAFQFSANCGDGKVIDVLCDESVPFDRKSSWSVDAFDGRLRIEADCTREMCTGTYSTFSDSADCEIGPLEWSANRVGAEIDSVSDLEGSDRSAEADSGSHEVEFGAGGVVHITSR